jgi:hypothetical protein
MGRPHLPGPPRGILTSTPPPSDSATYHLLGSASERIYGVLLRADLVGIALLIFGSYVP